MAADSTTNGANSRSADANGSASYSDRFTIADHFIGGNKLENAAASKVKDFVAQNDGHTVITNVSDFIFSFRFLKLYSISPFPYLNLFYFFFFNLLFGKLKSF